MSEESTSNSNEITKQSTDGTPYTSLSTPCEIELDTIDYTGHTKLSSVGGFPVHHIYVECNEIKRKYLPLDANPREPSTTAQVRAMQETLQKHPDDFIKKNNGMVLLCNEVNYNEEEGSVTLSFFDQEGVCNGGHTYFSIYITDDIGPEATVHLETIQIPEEITGDERREEIVGIAQARNNNNRLERRSEADYLGYYDPFKEALEKPDMVSWHEGDSEAHQDAIDAVHFIRLMKSLDPLAYYHPLYNESGDRHKSPATARTSVHNSWYEQMERAMLTNGDIPIKYLVPLSNDMLWLRDLVSYSLKHEDLGPGFRKTSLYQDYLSEGERELSWRKFAGEFGWQLTPPLEVLFTGLFRTNLWMQLSDQDESVQLVGWFEHPRDLWNARKSDILDEMAQYFTEADSDPKDFIRISAPYEKDLFTLGFNQDPPDPQIIYLVQSQRKFIESEYDQATHWLDTESGRGLVPLELELAPDGSTHYKFD